MKKENCSILQSFHFEPKPVFFFFDVPVKSVSMFQKDERRNPDRQERNINYPGHFSVDLC